MIPLYSPDRAKDLFCAVWRRIVELVFFSIVKAIFISISKDFQGEAYYFPNAHGPMGFN